MRLVFFGADGPAHPLRQPDGGGRDDQIIERVAPAAAQPFRTRFAHRVIRRCERQFGDEQRFTQGPGQVQPFAEGLHAENDAGQSLLYPLAVLGQQQGAGHGGLYQHLIAHCGGQCIGGLAHLFAGGEQHQRTGGHVADVMQQLVHHLLGECGGFAWVCACLVGH